MKAISLSVRGPPAMRSVRALGVVLMGIVLLGAVPAQTSTAESTPAFVLPLVRHPQFSRPLALSQHPTSPARLSPVHLLLHLHEQCMAASCTDDGRHAGGTVLGDPGRRRACAAAMIREISWPVSSTSERTNIQEQSITRICCCRTRMLRT